MVRVCRRGHEEHVVNDWWIEQEVARRHQARTEIHRRGLETWVAQQNVTKSVSPVAAITLQIAKRVKHRTGVDEGIARPSSRAIRHHKNNPGGFILQRVPAECAKNFGRFRPLF